MHYVKQIMQEIFGPENFVAVITFQTAANQNTDKIQRLFDHIIWYAKDKKLIKIHKLYRERTHEEISKMFSRIDEKGERYRPIKLDSFTNQQIKNLKSVGRLTPNKKFAKLLPNDFPFREIHNVWGDTVFGHAKAYEKIYAVQTNTKVVERCGVHP